MALEQGMMDDFREFMKLRQEYLKQKHHSVTPDSFPAETIEPQHSDPQPQVPASQPQSPGSGFHVIPLPQDLQLNLAKCVKEEGMKVLTPETVFIQHAIRELTALKMMVESLNKLFSGLTHDNSTRSPLLPVAHQDEHAFRPIEVQEETGNEVPVPNRRIRTAKKRDAGNRRPTKNRKS
jgi:hypothetical protein